MLTSDSKKIQLLRYKGLIMVLVGATLWGLSGTVAQRLFQNEGFTPGWLVTMRLLISGILLLITGCFRNNFHQVFAVWHEPKDRIRLVIFGIIGMLGVQYTYFVAIQTGNAATATLLQYLAPLFIMVYLAIKYNRIPNYQEFIALGFALLGTFLLVTNGSIHQLSVSSASIAWGLSSAIALAFYTLYPSGLLQRWGSEVIIGWGMIIGGIALCPIASPWQIQGQHWSVITGLLVSFVIVFGTAIAFYLYIDSLRYITPTEASLLASAEPLSAVAASVIWLRLPLSLFEGIGGLCIVSTVLMLSLRPKNPSKTL
ncbi:MAG: EamA family transporter [Microcoleus sp. PH2017_10_PVI_O_A]|uniref:DMT family transporter n=1 Tax=unclassified Microcoleus TaxID=2642155 RepID=UPI001E10C3E6|nr:MULTISPECIES: DMT family transporter [unclassified Microcoleus]MCC3409271.1 EamA family transporter [Microcoleus sp. PH2017_10_PVI_O_A]MCC3463504.1 EamA family transporter [Microcoleus sp. PH2017_11_PCY_U_A]MCC3481859.1 EamA family transporter [Microcoleus sp. PH2017_12_PCY_D_A]MCC3562804.1 EamA family transporter [Microcoleus sp. PH2017_27_LUM_O_A]